MPSSDVSDAVVDSGEGQVGRGVGWAVAVCRGLGHAGRLGVLLALRNRGCAKQELVREVGGARASVYRYVQGLTRLGLVESRVVGLGRGCITWWS